MSLSPDIHVYHFTDLDGVPLVAIDPQEPALDPRVLAAIEEFDVIQAAFLDPEGGESQSLPKIIIQ